MNQTIGKEFLILKELNSGATSNIYLVKSIKSEEIYAAKVYKKESERKYFYKEIESLKRLYNAPGIAHLVTYGENSIIKEGIPEDEIQQYIILDYLSNKDLFFFVKNFNGINENKIKSLFHKILKPVEQCHSNGIYHRDIKLENILLDNENNPILCDFGFAGFIEEVDDSGYLNEFLGTNHYASPEILRQIPYNGIKSDIFSLGVMLFCLIFRSFPFSSATKSNSLYKLIFRKKYKEYWEEIGKKIGINKVESVSEECKILIFKMLAYNPNERPSIDEIYRDEWMKVNNYCKNERKYFF